MTIFKHDRVTEVLQERPGLQRLHLASGDRAYSLTEIFGVAQVGDDVIVNTSAVDLGLGTGGWHVLHWNLSRDPGSASNSGHIMKVRYTSLQHSHPMIEEMYHEPGGELRNRLRGRRVLVAGLHSQVGIAALVARHIKPEWRIAYVMTDGAALPIALSDMVASLVEKNIIDHTVTAGQSFGGEFESLTVESGVAGCFEHLEADLVIVGMGPGIAGSGTQLGNTAIECAAAINNLRSMGAEVSFAVRYSDGDARTRHQGVSHHSSTIIDLCRDGVLLGIPADHAQNCFVAGAVPVDVRTAMDYLGVESLTPTSMGRGFADDPGFYAHTAAAVAVHLARQHS